MICHSIDFMGTQQLLWRADSYQVPRSLEKWDRSGYERLKLKRWARGGGLATARLEHHRGHEGCACSTDFDTRHWSEAAAGLGGRRPFKLVKTLVLATRARYVV